MIKQNKIYLIFFFFIWPFWSLFRGLRNFDIIGRNLYIALYAFLGFTSYSVGDLERYESQFYVYKSQSFIQIFSDIQSMQVSKVYNALLSKLVGSIFDSHHYYFSIAFLVYGYFYVKTIFIIKEISHRKLNTLDLVFFLGILMFFMIKPIPNLAFYTGINFIVFICLSYVYHNNKKLLWFLFIIPFFHYGLNIYLLIPFFCFIFGNKTWWYLSFVFVTFFVGQSTFISSMDSISEKNSGTFIDSKYEAYVSETGKARMDERYATEEQGYNIKLRSLNYLRDLILYIFVPVGMVIIFLKRDVLLKNIKLLPLFHLTLIFYGISNVMINMSQGIRFLLSTSFVASALFFLVYVNMKNKNDCKIFNRFCMLYVPILFLFGIMTAYASNFFISYSFFISNFPIEIILR
jgi:hypothetical protein